MRVTLKNFIAYPTLQENFSGVNLITGPTGAGKSTILDAITWAICGKARGFANKNESINFKNSPSLPMSVRLDGLGDFADSINRASKLTIEPPECAERIVDSTWSARWLALSSPWSFLSLNERDRAAMLQNLSDAAAIDDDDILAAIVANVEAPKPGIYNGNKWGDFGSVAGALDQALEHRRQLHAAATAKTPQAMLDRLQGLTAQLAELDGVKPEDFQADEETVARRAAILAELEAANRAELPAAEEFQQRRKAIHDKLNALPDMRRPESEAIDHDDPDALEDRAAELAEESARHAGRVEAGKEILHVVQEVAGNSVAVSRIEEWIDNETALAKKAAKAKTKALAQAERVRESANELAASIESWNASERERENLQRQLMAIDNESLRYIEAAKKQSEKELAAVELEIKRARIRFEGRQVELREMIDDQKKAIAKVENDARVAKQKRERWDQIVKVLQPEGVVATSLAQRSVSGLDKERLRWSADRLGVDVRIANDGSINLGPLNDRQASRGQRLLMAIALQDCFCFSYDFPLLLVDELESLGLGEELGRVLQFFTEAAEDYQAIIAAMTLADGQGIIETSDAIQVWQVGGGILKRLAAAE